MEVVINGLLLDVSKNEWEYEGQKGVTFKLHVYSDGTLYKVTVPAEDVAFYEGQINQTIEITCSLYIKGTYNLKVK